MSETFDKFNDWLRAVCVSPHLTGTDKLVMSYIAVFYVRHGEDTFCVRQSTIAERCAVSRKSVNGAMARARSAGYLAVDRRRDRGTGKTRADELRITLPKLGNEWLHHQQASDVTIGDTTPLSDVTKSSELCNQIVPSDVTESPELCNRTNTPTSENDYPTGLDTGFSTGLGSRVLRASDDDDWNSEVIDAEIVDSPRHASELSVFSDLFGLAIPSVNPVASRRTLDDEPCRLCGGTGFTDDDEYHSTGCSCRRTRSR